MDERQLKADQQSISAQDKYVLERHVHKKLPLNGAETSIEVDSPSLNYREWLRANNVSYGAMT